MRKHLLSCLALSLTVILPFFGTGCKTYENSATYFNTYYNMNRIMGEAEEEFEYQDEKKRILPRVLFIDHPGLKLGETEDGQPKFLKAFMIESQKLQPVRVKVDSIVIKGSKILAKYGKSDFIDNSLYLMGKAFFYRSEWVPSQEKCKELLDQFPESNLAPDASLLLSKDYLIQKKYTLGKTQLSRTIDIAWQHERYDILSEAFRLQAEMALYESNFEGALRPYRQAIAQSDNDEQNARWQVDLASLLYRQGKFAQAEKEFANVDEYSPDVVTRFEADLYRASSLMHLQKFAEAEKILDELDRNSNYEEWKSFSFAQRLELARLQNNAEKYDELAKHADTAYTGSKSVTIQYFERGMDYYRESNYALALQYFQRAKNLRSPVFDASAKMYDNLSVIDKKMRFAQPLLTNIEKKLIRMDDTVFLEVSKAVFDAARAYEQLGNLDSAKKYYTIASELSPEKAPERGRFLYNHARIVQKENPEKADSLYELLVDRYGRSEFGAEARRILGFVQDSETDTAADLYYSGSRFRNIGDYPMAQRQYLRVADEFPGSKFAPRALYALGWLHEHYFMNRDSALHYYSRLTGKFPESEYAKEVALSVAFADAERLGQAAPDSLLPAKYRAAMKSEKGEAPVSPPQEQLRTAPEPNKNAVQEPDKTAPAEEGSSIPGFDMIKQGLQKIPSLVPDLKLDVPGLDKILPKDKEEDEEEEEEAADEKQPEQKPADQKQTEQKQTDPKPDQKQPGQKQPEQNDKGRIIPPKPDQPKAPPAKQDSTTKKTK